MNRFFVESKNVNEDEITVTGEDVQHISKVLRLRQGDRIMLCDGEGTDYLAEILEIDKHSVRTEIITREPSRSEPDIEVVLYQGIPKAAKMDLIIQKCTEMGIRRIVPVYTTRTVVKLESEKDERKKVERWAKIAEEAAKQSGRGAIPTIAMPVDLAGAFRDASGLDMVIMPYELAGSLSLKELLQKERVKSIGFFIGPEGGFEAEEVMQARSIRAMPVTLGKRILRTETAGIAVLTGIMYEYDQLK
ncbi:MAG TPA: 16S rRNA (uracil(1498)-N(3))-methyltransferase [Negativicutes bacterium]|nr:16S rRNA (uracil(1498)-N(3))-methyltransferase [Negativicutes bacterium]